MLLAEVDRKLRLYNEHCLHYNLVADGCYRKLAQIGDPFCEEYLRYLVAALIGFDMGRQMGEGTKTKYDPDAGGFAARLKQKIAVVKLFLSSLIHQDLLTLDIERFHTDIREAYDELSQGNPFLHAQNKGFHVGTTKILHFCVPDLFPIVDSYAARVFRAEFGIDYKPTTQPGYGSGKYIEVIKCAREEIKAYGEDGFVALEPGTPLMRLFDKIVFAHGNNWEKDSG